MPEDNICAASSLQLLFNRHFNARADSLIKAIKKTTRWSKQFEERYNLVKIFFQSDQYFLIHLKQFITSLSTQKLDHDFFRLTSSTIKQSFHSEQLIAPGWFFIDFIIPSMQFSLPSESAQYWNTKQCNKIHKKEKSKVVFTDQSFLAEKI